MTAWTSGRLPDPRRGHVVEPRRSRPIAAHGAPARRARRRTDDNIGLARARDVVTRDLATAVGTGFHEALAPSKFASSMPVSSCSSRTAVLDGCLSCLAETLPPQYW